MVFNKCNDVVRRCIGGGRIKDVGDEDENEDDENDDKDDKNSDEDGGITGKGETGQNPLFFGVFPTFLHVVSGIIK